MAKEQSPATAGEPPPPPDPELPELEDLRLRAQAAEAQTRQLRRELRRTETELEIAKRVIASFNAEGYRGT